MERRKSPGPKARLSRAAVIAAALDCEGQDMTMRAVAERLHTTPSAIYRYFAGHDDLVVAVLGEMLRAAPLPARGTPWRRLLQDEAALRWDILTRHSGLALDALSSFEEVAAPRLLALVDALTSEGFTTDEAVVAADTVLDIVHDGARQAVVIGRLIEDEASLQEYVASRPAALQDPVERIVRDPRGHVERKLDLVLAGLAAQLPSGASRRRGDTRRT